MSLLHFLRSSSWLARLAVLWFALTLAAAAASPLVHPQEQLLVCTSTGMQQVLVNADGTVSTSSVSDVSCPLCITGGAPPPATVLLAASVHGVALLPQGPQAAHPTLLQRQPAAGARSPAGLTPIG